MSGECFHYADFIAHEVGDETDFPRGEAQPTKSHRNIDQSSFTIKRLPRLVDQFRSAVRCPYCPTTLETNESSSGHYWGKRTYDLLLFGGRCQHCNWWYIQENWMMLETRSFTVYQLTRGVICRFEQVFWGDAITKAENELIEYRRGLKKLQPRDVEIVVGKILSQYHECDVHQFGRSHDNGIDIIVIKGDADIAVQVKHHYQSDRVEGVRSVREFVGALVVKRILKGSSFLLPSALVKTHRRTRHV